MQPLFMKAIKRGLLAAILLLPFYAQGGTVRDVKTDETSMERVYLRMGQSTVLRFPEKPKKVVLGNANYYSVEFIDNDLAIQPLGTVGTNLFVYGEKNVYGFLLSTSAGGRYDDLIHVHWRAEQPKGAVTAKATLKTSMLENVSAPGISLHLPGAMEAKIVSIKRFKSSDFYVLDLHLESQSENRLDISGLVLEATRQKKVLPSQKFVVKASALGIKEYTRARVFLRLTDKRGFTLHMRLAGKEVQKIVSRRLL